METELRDLFSRERFISLLQREQWVGNDRRATCLRLERNGHRTDLNPGNCFVDLAGLIFSMLLLLPSE